MDVPSETTEKLWAWGQEHENDAIAAYEIIMADIVTDSQQWIAYEDWSGCTIDGRSEVGLVECKCPQKLPDEPSVGYWIQVQSQMQIADESKADLCVWTPTETRIWRAERWGEYWTTVEPILKEYYECLRGSEPKKRQFSKVSLPLNWERIV